MNTWTSKLKIFIIVPAMAYLGINLAKHMCDSCANPT